jgi:hydroxyproline O-galactosyltransferase 2/3/4/5/6
MKRAKSSDSLSGRRWRPAKLLLIAVVVYLAFTSAKLLLFFSKDASSYSVHSRLIQYDQSDQILNVELDQNDQIPEKDSSVMREPTRRPDGYGRITGEILRRYAQAQSRSRSWTRTGNFSELERVAQEAWVLGHKAWDEAVNYINNGESESAVDPDPEKKQPCPTSVGSSKGRKTGKDGERVVLLPCGLAVGSSITIIGID